MTRLSYALAVLCIALFGCTKESSETHLLPDGYTGPVVIVFRDPSGISLDTQKRERTFQLPSNGILRIKEAAPPDGIVRTEFFYVGGAQGKRELPAGKGKDEFQIFAEQDGTIGSVNWTKADGEVTMRGPGVQWTSYIVGVPSSRPDWIQLQREFVKAAVGDD